jgi:hypothetical protein
MEMRTGTDQEADSGRPGLQCPERGNVPAEGFSISNNLDELLVRLKNLSRIAPELKPSYQSNNLKLSHCPIFILTWYQPKGVTKLWAT